VEPAAEQAIGTGQTNGSASPKAVPTQTTTAQAASEETELVYGLEDRPDTVTSVLAAVQHVLAGLVAIITAPLVVGTTLGLGEHTPYLMSMALIVSGIGSFIQSRRIGPVGSGLLTLQGTSFSFVSAFIAAGTAVRKDGGTTEEILAMIIGLGLAGAVIPTLLSGFIPRLKRIFAPVVTGTAMTIIGLSLIGVAFKSLGGGPGTASYGAPENLLLGMLVIAIIIGLSVVPNLYVRVGAILGGMLIGSLVAIPFGLFDLSMFATKIGQAPAFTVPTPLRYGVAFSWNLFLPIAVLYVVLMIESIGDLTATSVISRQPIDGPVYLQRIRGGALADGVSCFLAGVLNSFPSKTFAQNNGVIQITGIASRHIAVFVAPLLILIGLFPAVSTAFTAIPQPVIGGALIVLFGSVAVSGVRILSGVEMNRKNVLTMSVSLGLGIGVALTPEAIGGLPDGLRGLAGSPIAVGGLSAMVLTLVLPETRNARPTGPA
jgi:xanthine permease XanP